MMAPHSVEARAFIVALKASGKTSKEIFCLTGISVSTIDKIYARAIERGFEPADRPWNLLNLRLEDGERSGRPLIQEEVTERVAEYVRRDRFGREKSCADLAGALSQEGFNILAVTVWRVLKEAGFRKTKPTRKPGLTKKMRQD